MNLIKTSKEVECFIRAILYPESRVTFICDNEQEAKDCFSDMKNMIKSQSILQEEITNIHNPIIKFKNGSSIEVLSPSKEECVVRGKRANVSPRLYDFESPEISDEILDEVLKPFMVEDSPNFKRENDCIWCSSRK